MAYYYGVLNDWIDYTRVTQQTDIESSSIGESVSTNDLYVGVCLAWVSDVSGGKGEKKSPLPQPLRKAWYSG